MMQKTNYYQKLPLPEEKEMWIAEKDSVKGFKNGNLQDIFLNNCRKNQDSVVVRMLDGSWNRGKIIGFDSQSVIMCDQSRQLMIYKTGIISISPDDSVQYIFNEAARS